MVLSHRKELVTANLIAILGTIAAVPVPLLIPLLVDEVLLHKPGTLVAWSNRLFPESWQGPVLYIFAVLLLTLVLRLLALAFNVWQVREFTRISKDVIFRIRRDLLQRLQYFSMAEYEVLGPSTVASHLVTRRSATTSQARCGYTPVSHMTGRRVRMLPWDPLWRLRHVGYPVSPRGYRGLPAFASLSMAGSGCPTRHLHPSREQAFVAGDPSTTNTTRSTSPGWPFSLPKALYSSGFLRKAADFESQPSTLSCPGFLSDSAIPLCFREGGHAAESGSPRHTLPGDTGTWTRPPMKPSARAVFGVAECQWSYSSIPGTPPIATAARHGERSEGCYGPRSCTLYKAGAPRKMPGRKVPGRKGMTWVEEETTHRGPDE